MEQITVSIDDNSGETQFMLMPETECLLDETSVIKRASHVLPWNPVLRVLFTALRWMFGDYGHIAEFTRMFPCKWQVDLTPVGGPVVPVEWATRDSAIKFEIEWLQDNFFHGV